MRLSTICEVVLVLTALCATITKCGATNGVASIASRGRVRRQTSDSFTPECSAILIKVGCSTSYVQNYINAISKCENRARDSIQTLEEDCQKNAEGRFCGEVLSYIDNNCSSSSCSPACDSSLQQAGCCANNALYSDYLTRCGISVPSPCPKSSLTIPTFTSDDLCDSGVEYTKTEITAQCNNVNPVLEETSKHEMCEKTIDYYRTFCSSRNGQFCLVEFNYGTSNSSLYSTTIQNSINNCPSSTNCSTACKSALISVKNTIGCCFHVYNLAGFFSSKVGNLSLWNECGVSVPQRCAAAYMKIGVTFIAIIILQILAL